MNRATFLGCSTAAALSGVLTPPGAFAAALRDTMTQDDLFASLPPGRAGEWTDVILGSGARFRKQIGLGADTSPAQPARLYVETQVGILGGSLDPSSVRKAYLRDAAFGSLVRPYAIATNIGRFGNAIYRYGDSAPAANPPDASRETMLHLLDLPWLYDRRPLHVLSAEPERIRAAGAVRETIHIVARYGAPRSSHDRLERIDLWHAPHFPFGVARYQATLRGLDPFELKVTAHGDDFATMLPGSPSEVFCEG